MRKGKLIMFVLMPLLMLAIGGVWVFVNRMAKEPISTIETYEDGSIKTSTVSGKYTHVRIESASGDTIHEEASAMETNDHKLISYHVWFAGSIILLGLSVTAYTIYILRH